MPQAKKRAAAPRRAGTFKEPAALKRLSKSLDTAHEALSELRKDTGRDVSQGARDVYKDLRTFVANARRDAGKLTRALTRDFDQAEKRVANARRGGRSAAAGRKSAPKRSTRKASTRKAR